MTYILENEKLKVAFSNYGAEIVSVINKTNNFEYMWQPDPKYWDRQSPVIFPVCGRFFDLKYKYRGQLYDMECHGFGWEGDFSLAEKRDNKIVFELTDNEEIRKIYPFAFSFKVAYILDGNTIKTEFTVKNNGDNTMYFSLGAHPGFNVPLSDDEEFEDYYIDFGERVSPEIIHNFHDNSGFEPYHIPDGQTIALKHSVFDEDGIFLRNVRSSFAAIRSRKCSRAVEVSFKDFPYVGIWHEPFTDAGYVCIEPWYSLPCSNGQIPDIEKDVDMLSLNRGEVYENGYEFKII